MNIKFSRAYSRGTRLNGGVIGIQDGRFSRASGKTTLDLSAYTLLPGFIDAHTHGGGGLDFSSASVDELDELSEFYASNGVTTVIATTATDVFDNTLDALKRISERMAAGTRGARIGGIYLEGPYLSKEFRGAHAENLLREPKLDEIKKLIGAANGNLRAFALAPELPGALDAIALLLKNKVRVCLGHSAADMKCASAAFDAGADELIHTFNAMASLKHREVGLLGTALTRDDVYCELICDFIHVCPQALEIVFKLKGYDRVIMITDSISAAGMPDGNFVLGGLPVIVKNSIARIENGALAGSSLKMNYALKNVVDTLGVSISDALKCVTENPARAMGLADCGTLRPGSRADLVALDENFGVVMTIVGGEVVYDAR